MSATLKNDYWKWAVKACLFLVIVRVCFGQGGHLQKTITLPSSCRSWKLNMYERNLNINFKDFSKYVNECCKGGIIATDVAVRVTFTKDSLPCCNAVIISDSTMASTRQVLSLKDCVMSYPKLKEGILYRIGETHKCAEFLVKYNHILGVLKVTSNNLVGTVPKR